MNKTGDQKGLVRIIGGSLRGRKVSFTDASPDQGLRPTTDRIRETLFNWLSTSIVDKECLDAFAGSGALSFEAISRGAKHVTLIEQSSPTLKNIQENAERFNIQSQLTFLCTDTLAYLAKTSQTFDIIFLDPPFQSDLLLPCIQCLAERQLLRAGGMVYIESHTPLSEKNTPWIPHRFKKAGGVYYGLFLNND